MKVSMHTVVWSQHQGSKEADPAQTRRVDCPSGFCWNQSLIELDLSTWTILSLMVLLLIENGPRISRQATVQSSRPCAEFLGQTTISHIMLCNKQKPLPIVGSLNHCICLVLQMSWNLLNLVLCSRWHAVQSPRLWQWIHVHSFAQEGFRGQAAS